MTMQPHESEGVKHTINLKITMISTDGFITQLLLKLHFTMILFLERQYELPKCTDKI